MRNRCFLFGAGGIVILSLPVIINYLCLKAPIIGSVANDNNWISFFGSYLGAIVGGLFAFLIAWVQISEKINYDRMRDNEMNRSFVMVHEFLSSYDLSGVKMPENSRLIITEQYEKLESAIQDGSINKNKTFTFYKIWHTGLPEVIFNCSVHILISAEKDDSKTYEVNSSIGVIEKTEEIFIPLFHIDFPDDEIIVRKLEISYITTKKENMLLEHDFDKKREVYYLVNGERTKLMELNLIGTRWNYPNK